MKLIGYLIPTGQAPMPTPSPTPLPTPTETPIPPTQTPTPMPTETPTATVQPADATATAQANETATAQQANVDATATAQAATATAQAATATALALAGNPSAQATATAQANATATAQAGMPTATPVAGPGVAPSGLTVAERTRSQATISWIPGADATSQAVAAITSGDTKFDLNLRSDARSYTFTGLRPQVYTYYVIAADSSGSYRAPSGSTYAASVTDSGPPVLDAKPKNLSVRRTGNTAILSWTPGTEAASHIVAAHIPGDDSSTQLSASLAANTDSYTFGGLKQGVYTYYVLALDQYGGYYFDSVMDGQ